MNTIIFLVCLILGSLLTLIVVSFLDAVEGENATKVAITMWDILAKVTCPDFGQLANVWLTESLDFRPLLA